MNASPTENADRLDDADRAWRARLQGAAPQPAFTPDLWPAIAARLEPRASLPHIGSAPLAAIADAARRGRARRRTRLQSLLAVACLLMLVVRAAPLRPLQPEPEASLAQAHPLDTLLLREAEGLEREYAAAFAQFEGAPLPAAYAAGLQALDIEGRRIHGALLHSPDQAQLLDQLRRVHERRLQLLRRSLEATA